MIQRHPRPRMARVPVSTADDLAVIACHFNWPGFIRPVQNLHRFLRQMKRDGVEVYGVEVQLPDRKLQTKHLPNWKQIQANEDNILFQKEAALNIAAAMVPEHFTKIAWIDADVWFEDPQWVGKTSALLDKVKICQPWGQAWWTDRDGSTALGKPAAALLGIDKGSGHPGFAWAAQRSFFTEAGGLYSLSPVGSGDSILSTVLFNQNSSNDGVIYGVGINHITYHTWASMVQQWLEGSKVAYLPGAIWHEWHGERKNRQYIDRRVILREFDTQLHLRLNKHGLIEWTQAAPEHMREFVRNYFISRQEDG